MTRTLLFPLMLSTAAVFGQLAPDTNAPLIDHLREVNAEWKDHNGPLGSASFSNDAQRIALHLHLVREELARRTPEGLSAEQARQRAYLLNALGSYADAGRFPQNHVLPYRNPVFIDPHNTACAVGQLMIVSGHEALAQRIDAEMELAYIREIRLDEVERWATEHGFTESELAWIQPAYAPDVPWYPLGGGTDGEVTELLQLSNGDLLVAGQFEEAGEAARFHVARWDGDSYEAMGTLPEGVVNAAIEYDGQILLGGSFNGSSADLLTWNGTTWSASTAFPGKSSAITAFHEYLGTLHAAGSRDGFAGTDHFAARLTGGDWQMVGQVLNGPIRAFATLNGDLYIGGEFTGAFLSPDDDILHVARMGNASWGQVGDGLDGAVHAMLVYNDELYATGDMVSMAGSYFGLARIAHNATTWEQLMPNITNYIFSPLDGLMTGLALAERDGEIYIGGDFNIGEMMLMGSGLAVFHGQPDAVEPYANFMGPVRDIEFHGSDVLVIAGASEAYTNIASADLTTGLDDNPAKLSFTVTPNPVVDLVNVQLPEAMQGTVNVRVLDARGRVVELRVERNGRQVRVNAQGLATGHYTVEASDGTMVAMGKFMKD
ncbi:MAG: T9SS type A sorting domain-containing protein [Flavobacteriales bacterium]|nr:T9SS type A sorting domain-containing protein [Flavobacteriales bacterium]